MTQEYTIRINEEQRKIIHKVLEVAGRNTHTLDFNEEQEQELSLLDGMFHELRGYPEDAIYEMCDEGPTVSGWATLRQQTDVKEQHPDFPEDEPVDALDVSLPAIGSDY